MNEAETRAELEYERYRVFLDSQPRAVDLDFEKATKQLNKGSMSSAMKKKTPSMMMTTIVTAATAAAVTDLLGVARFQVAPPMTPWSLISALERHLWRFKIYLLTRHIWRFKLTIDDNAPL